MKTKQVPLRQCVACREHLPKRDLVRVVKSPEGVVSLDFSGKKPGRGAYICPKKECLEKAKKSRALERAFSAQIGDEVYDALAKELEEASIE